MKKLIAAIVVFFLFLYNFSNASSEDLNSTLRKGNNFFKEKKYALALQSYKMIETKGFQSSVLFYNIGTSYLKLDSLGMAVYYLSRAQKMNPSDEDINFNLQQAKQKTIDKLEPFPEFFLLKWFKIILLMLAPDVWAFSTLFFVFLTCVFMLLFLLSAIPSKKSKLLGSSVFSGALSLVFFVLAYFSLSMANNTDHLVIIAPSSSVYSAPTQNSTKLFLMHEGATAQIEEVQENWVNAKFSNGTKGWVSKAEIGQY